MWRGWHKLPGGDAAFDALANIPSTFSNSSSEGPIDVVSGNGEQLFAIVVDGIFHESLYDSIIQTAEKEGFKPALLNQGSGQQEIGITLTSVRSGERCIIESSALADKLWPLVEQHLPHRDIVPGKRYKNWTAVGINPKFRVLKYSSGDRFELHQDGSYYVNSQIHMDESTVVQQSFVTFQLYLNDGGGADFVGGATRFIQPTKIDIELNLGTRKTSDNSASIADVYEVVPKAGRLLLFQHNCWHEGETVTKGIKYVLRSEVMYSKV